MTKVTRSSSPRVSKVEAARRRIQRELASGPRPASEVIAALDRWGVADRTRKRAKSGGAYETRRIGRAWWWALPAHGAELDAIANRRRKGATASATAKRATQAENHPGPRKGANPGASNSANRAPTNGKNTARLPAETALDTPALARAHTRGEILMPSVSSSARVAIRDPLASAIADELEALMDAPTGLSFTGVTITARPGVDVAARALRLAAVLAGEGGGAWFVAEHSGHLHFHGVAACPEPTLAARAIERDPGGSADAQHLDPLRDGEHLRRLVRYATKYPSWDPDDVVVSGVMTDPWGRACRRAGARRRTVDPSSVPPLESDAWAHEMARWPVSLQDQTAILACNYVRLGAATGRHLLYSAYLAMRGAPAAVEARRPSAADTQRGTARSEAS